MDRMTQYNGRTYTYDANGNLATIVHAWGTGVTTFEYDNFGNLRAVDTDWAPATGWPDVHIEYIVDGKGRRVGKRRQIEGEPSMSLVRQYVWDDARLVAELDGSGNLLARYFYPTGSHSPDFVEYAGTLYGIVKEPNGTVSLVVAVDDPSNVLQWVQHDEFGRRVSGDGPLSIGFAGGLYDSDTKLVRFGARDYDPEVGRWTARDPILFEGGQANLYVYVGNDPVNRVDPDGLRPPATPKQCSDLMNHSSIIDCALICAAVGGGPAGAIACGLICGGAFAVAGEGVTRRRPSHRCVVADCGQGGHVRGIGGVHLPCRPAASQVGASECWRRRGERRRERAAELSALVARASMPVSVKLIARRARG